MRTYVRCVHGRANSRGDGGPVHPIGGGAARLPVVRETTSPDLPGFDDLVSERGTPVTYSDGSAADIRHVPLTGRTGATVMTSCPSGPPEVEQQIRQGAEDALALMRSRLAQR
ncbi:hypothetical protein OG930_28890 [Streptomyces sp. NBC_01799]|uniref:hypothetical protein n=1 Tax=Streptomyces sp. NBC_01800 TaxID=2975945 RepID=UPI002DD9A334|nr:hypothetical protein [Streptomyces sp. NBC_01800]WSA70780.1 hypothetical protein OIE65_29565 [Streptomyces sp. NBC_01800]WSA79279.1 hypothetical protein OG930_28890 [Streptomyces sp. NBC_01799]